MQQESRFRDAIRAYTHLVRLLTYTGLHTVALLALVSHRFRCSRSDMLTHIYIAISTLLIDAAVYNRFISHVLHIFPSLTQRIAKAHQHIVIRRRTFTRPYQVALPRVNHFRARSQS